MRRYPWLRSHFKQLISRYQARRWHHALLIQSVPGTGDSALIDAITHFLMCQHPEEEYKICRKCRGCQLMQARVHPDYYKLGWKKDSNTLGVDAIHDLCEKLYKHASLVGVKVVWLNNVALLTGAATNALLKILEEPPEKTYFFLSCYELGLITATLRSRCCLYRLAVPQEEKALSWLQQKTMISQDIALTSLRLCCGAPIAALELLQKKNWAQRAQFFLALNSVLCSHDWLGLLSALNHEQASVYLQWLITLLIDALKFQQGVTTITNVDSWLLVSNLAETLTNTNIHAIINALFQCYKQLLTVPGINRELVLTNCLLTIEYYLQSDSILPASHF